VTLERKFQHVASVHRKNLGRWSARKCRDINAAEACARQSLEALYSAGYTADYLRQQWEAQQKEQLSVRSCTQKKWMP
jgi:hypothetical protein